MILPGKFTDHRRSKKMQENMFITDSLGFEFLYAQGFTLDQAIKLVAMKENFEELTEYRERTEEQNRLNFVRWLFEHGKISE
jgi:hypothetical protein